MSAATPLEPDALAEICADVEARLLRVRVVADSAGSMLRELQGSQIDRAEMLALFDLIFEQANEGRNALGPLVDACSAQGAAP